MISWQIQLLRPAAPDRLFVERLLYSLVSHGVRYNAGKYSGTYRIIPINPNEEIHQKEESDEECTERLADIAEMYSDFDPKTTQLGIDLSYSANGEPLDFRVRVNPTDDSQTIVSISLSSTEVKSSDEFKTVVDICTTVFERLDFIYGSYRSEHHEQIPTTTDEILNEPAQIVTFYSSSLAEMIGKKRLLSAPAHTVRELDNRGILLVACTDPQGCPDELRSLNDHLGKDN